MDFIKKYIFVFLISMVPLIELRGAIPYAIGFSLPLFESYVVAIIGNMVPVPFIFFFARKILEWGKGLKISIISKFCNFCLNKGEKAKEKLLATSKNGIYIALMLFVGIPLPGTGAWTGALVASVFHMDIKKSILAILLGILLALVIMSIISYGVIGNIIK